MVLSTFGHLLHGQRHVDGYAAHLLALAGHLFRRSSHNLRRVVDFAEQLVEVFHGQVQGVGHRENVARGGHFHTLGQVAFRDGAYHAAYFQHRRSNGFNQCVERVHQFFPRARYAAYGGALCELAFHPGHLCHAAYFGSEAIQVVHHAVDGVGQVGYFAFGFKSQLLGQVTLRYGGYYFHQSPHLRGQVGGHVVYVIGQVLPHTGHVGHRCLAAELALGAHFLRHPGYLAGEDVKRVHHLVQVVLQVEQLAVDVYRNLLAQVAARYGGGHVGNVPYLRGQVAGHRVHVVGQVFPGAAHVRHFGLAAELAFGAHFAGHPGYFVAEDVERVHHFVQVLFQLQQLATHVHRDFLTQVAFGYGRGHVGNVPHLRGQVAGHRVHIVSQVFPGARYLGHVGLAAQNSFGAYFAGHAGYFAGEDVERVHHLVQVVLQVEQLAFHVNGDFLAQIAFRYGGGHVGNVPYLRGQVAGHRVHVIGQLLPGAAHAGHHGLAAEPALGAHFAGHAGHLVAENIQRVHHLIQDVLQLQDFALHVHRHLLAQVAAGHGGGHVGNVAHLRGEGRGHVVYVVGQGFPDAGHVGYRCLAAELALGTHFLRHAGYFAGKQVQRSHHLVQVFLQLQELALHINGHRPGQVAFGHGGGHVGNVPHLAGQVAGHVVHIVGEVFPHAGHRGHAGLAAELALGAHFLRHPGYFAGKQIQRVHHLVQVLL